MNEIRDFILKHYRVASIGCLDWNFDPDGAMYDEYYKTARVCEQMLHDTGMDFNEILAIHQKFIEEEVKRRNAD